MNLWTYRAAKLISSTIFGRKSNITEQNKRVLMFHSIVKPNNSHSVRSDLYSMTERRFIQHLDVLNKYKIVPFDDLTSQGVSITFDDGYANTLHIAAKLLCERAMPFSVFVIPAKVIEGDPNFLSLQELRMLSKMSGVTIGCHGYSHLSLADLSREQVEQELVSSKNWLEDVLEKPVTTMSYPHGSYNSVVTEIAARVGYIFAATSNWGEYKLGTDQLQVPRIDVWSLDNPQALKQKLDGKWDWIGRLI